MSAQPGRSPGVSEQAAAVLEGVSWPDGGHDGMPTRKVAGMLAEALDDAGLLRSPAAADETLRARVEAAITEAMRGNTHRGTNGNFVSVTVLRALLDTTATEAADTTEVTP